MSEQGPGELVVPPNAVGLVLLACGRPQLAGAVSATCGDDTAAILNARRLATLRFALLSEQEAEDPDTRADVVLLSIRWEAVLLWLAGRDELAGLRMGLFGACEYGVAALRVASRGRRCDAVVARSAALDQSNEWLREIEAPTLLLVGDDDGQALAGNRAALPALRCRKRLEVVPGAGRHFDDHGAPEVVSQLAAEWFQTHLTSRRW